jgi:hypothetical protein
LGTLYHGVAGWPVSPSAFLVTRLDAIPPRTPPYPSAHHRMLHCDPRPDALAPVPFPQNRSTSGQEVLEHLEKRPAAEARCASANLIFCNANDSFSVRLPHASSPIPHVSGPLAGLLRAHILLNACIESLLICKVNVPWGNVLLDAFCFASNFPLPLVPLGPSSSSNPPQSFLA